MESQSRPSPGSRVEPWIALALCVAVAVGRIVAPRLSALPADALAPARAWLPLAAAAFAAAGIVRRDGWPQWPRIQRASRWIAVLLMVWAANGLPFDLLTMTGAMGRRTASGAIVIATVDWPRLATRTLAWPPPSCSRISPWRATPSLHPPVQRPGTATPRSSWRCRTRFSGRCGRWAGRRGSLGPGRAARATPHWCSPSRGWRRPFCPCSSSRRGAGCRAGCCCSQGGPPPPSSA